MHCLSNKISYFILIFSIAFFSVFSNQCLKAKSLTIYLDNKLPQAAFAANEILAALESNGHNVNTADFGLSGVAHGNSIFLSQKNNVDKDTESLKPEGFSITKIKSSAGDHIMVNGADPAGIMYGGLELAELIRIGDLDNIKDVTQNPYMQMRGTKFNIPLDVRTPSYTDMCDSSQFNMPEMWNMSFWKDYIDSIAKSRYNYISLWSLHPFPSLVKVPEFPDIALDDVKRSTTKFKEFYSLNGLGFDAPEIINNTETLKVMTIEEKINFWRKVMSYGKQRNVDFYFVTWNIFVNGTDGKYGITDSYKNQTTIDYFRKSVKQMFLTYPDLAGIGLTTGENMPGAKSDDKENWAFQTYGQGVLDAAKEQPNRKIRFIHRQHQTGAKDIARVFKPLIDNPNIDFIFSFKYAKAHVMSVVTQPYHKEFVNDIGDMKTIWTLRNDDNYIYRWGGAGFVRDFIANIPYDVSQGYYYGSDQWCWGREFLSLYSETPRQLEVEKHWYHWMLWGRLGYDPQIADSRFIDILQIRYPGIDTNALFQGWQEASMVYTVTTGFHWGSLDFQWYIEFCKSQPMYAQSKSGFHNVDRFINLPPHKCSGYMSIPKYVDLSSEQRQMSDMLTPFQVSEKLMNHSKAALEKIKSIDPGENKELRYTLIDIRIMAYLGHYYSHKIAGSTELALYRKSKDKKHQNTAITYLLQAAKSWNEYSSLSKQMYKNPLWTNRCGYCDWDILDKEVLNDIKIASQYIE